MLFEQWSILAVMSVMMLLFVFGKWRYDIVALMALFACALLNLIPTNQIFSGFGHPATITVAIVLILSYGLSKSGAVEGIMYIVSPLSNRPSLHIAVLIFIAAFFSMFMNNVGALALLMPVAIQSTVDAGRSPSNILMPLSFGSILGGLVTLIGTPPNIIISSYRAEFAGGPFEMFDFAPVGGVVALVGILFISLFGWRLVKARRSQAGNSLFEIESYLFEVKITKDSELVSVTIKELEEIILDYNISITSLIHKRQYYPVPPKKHELKTSDMLILEGAQEEVDKFVVKYKLALLGAENARKAVAYSRDTVMKEVVIPPRSAIEKQTVEQVHFKARHNVNLLAVSREGKSHRGRLRDMKLGAGDVLLLHGESKYVEESIKKFNFLPLANRKIAFTSKKMAMIAMTIFIVAIALSAFSILPIQESLGVAVLCMVVFGVINVREFYDAIDIPVIVLLGSMIPVGKVLETTGTTKILADQLLQMVYLLGDVPMYFILILVLVITMTLSDILNNAATAILMAPIAKNIAESASVSIDPFLMAVAVGSSCAFLTPIGHQNNALVMGPGGYKFSDYWRMGLPLEIIIVCVAIPMILLIWPL